MNNDYEVLSKFYGSLITHSGRLEAEKSVLQRIISRFGVEPDSNILDASCGTGHILEWLKSRGFKNVQGMDGSVTMCEIAQRLNPEVTVSHSRWQDISESNLCRQSFHLAFVLSNSFLHLDERLMDSALQNLFGILHDDGALVIDVRNWIQQSGLLLEQNRPEEIYRWSAEFEQNGVKYTVDDSCCYRNNRQCITYRILGYSSENPSRVIEQHFETVTYALVTANMLVQRLTHLGYENVELCQSKGWPYLLIVVRK